MSGDALRRDPFAPLSDAGLYQPRPASEEALDQILSYVRVGATQVALLGPDGIGKTLLLRVVAGRLEGAMRVVDVPYPALPADEIAGWILNLMGTTPSDDPERTLVQQARQLREEGSGLAILLDDAASTPLPALRRLSRIAREARPSLHIVMVVPDDHRGDDVLAAVGPDVEVVHYREPMSLEETRSYLDGRLDRAGATPELRRRFEQDALEEIYRESAGVAAEVNFAARRWWTQLSGLTVTPEATSAQPAPTVEQVAPEAPSSTALGAALLANATAIELDDPFQNEAGPATGPGPLSEAPTEIVSLDAARARPIPEAPEVPEAVPAPAAPLPVAAVAPRPVEQPPPIRAEEPAPESRPTPVPRSTAQRGVWRVAVVGITAALVAVAFVVGRWTADDLPAFWKNRTPGTAATRPPEPLAGEQERALASEAMPAERPADRPDAQPPALDPRPGTPEAAPPTEPLLAVAPPEIPPATGRAGDPLARDPDPTPAAEPTDVAGAETAALPDVAAAPPIDSGPGEPATDATDVEPVEVVEAGAEAAVAEGEADVAQEPEAVLVSINAVPWARIEIDGADAGLTPLADWPLEPGEHEFRAVFGDGREIVRREKIGPLNRRILFR